MIADVSLKVNYKDDSILSSMLINNTTAGVSAENWQPIRDFIPYNRLNFGDKYFRSHIKGIYTAAISYEMELPQASTKSNNWILDEKEPGDVFSGILEDYSLMVPRTAGKVYFRLSKIERMEFEPIEGDFEFDE